MYSLIIKNALIHTGDGTEPRLGSVAINENKIVLVQPKIESSAHETFDAKGKILAPGFIDVQNHSDAYWQIFENPSLDSILGQGYTTIAVGQCGASLAPLLSMDGLLAMQKWHNLEGVNVNWQSYKEFLEIMGQKKFGVNIASLVGHSTLRRAIVGEKTLPLSKDELGVIGKAFSQAMDEGAFGLSIGLAYGHDSNTTGTELEKLAELVASKDGLLSIHMRNESNEVIENLREALSLTQQSGARTKISHLKIRGKENWTFFPEVIELLEEAWHQGTTLHFDLYPYVTLWQPLHSYLPQWSIDAGRQAMLDHLKNPERRRKILEYLQNYHSNFNKMIIASSSTNMQVAGKTFSSLAKNLNMTTEEAILTVIENGGSEIMVFDEGLNQEQVTQLLNHPLALIATDGAGFPMTGLKGRLVHPRCYATAPKYLRGVIDSGQNLAEAIRKLTSSPAQVLGLSNRGMIKTDHVADLVLIDPETIDDQATLSNPLQSPTGIISVWVNGHRVVNSDKLLGINKGEILDKKNP